MRWARYRPDGERGCAFGVAHDGYGAADPSATMRAANDEIVLIGLIETVQGIERCEEIMAVPGLDVGWLGHYDLTNAMGITAQFDDPRFVASAERLAKACAACRQDRGDAGRQSRLHARADGARLPCARLCDRRRGDAERLPAGPRRAARGFLMRPAARTALTLAALALVLGACSRTPDPIASPPPDLTNPVQENLVANPASENCIAKGGELRIETAGDGGQYGVCLFEDNRPVRGMGAAARRMSRPAASGSRAT